MERAGSSRRVLSKRRSAVELPGRVRYRERVRCSSEVRRGIVVDAELDRVRPLERGAGDRRRPEQVGDVEAVIFESPPVRRDRSS